MEQFTTPNKRERMEEDSNPFAPSAGGPGNSGIRAGLNKYRRLFAQDTDDNHRDGKDEAQVPYGTGKDKATSSEAPEFPAPTPSPSKASPPSEEEIDAILRAEADFVEEGDDEVGDCLVIPNPDGDGVEDIPEGTMSSQPVIRQLTAIGTNSKFAQALLSAITLLIGWAKVHDLSRKGNGISEERAMTRGFWSLLTHLTDVSVDYLLALFIPAIPSDVQALFDDERWSMADFLSLPRIGNDERQGIYANFAVDAADEENGCGAYIGSTHCLQRRVAQHLGVARSYRDTQLPKKYSGSLHYGRICQNGTRSEFRKLASFDSPIEAGYLSLLEGVFMILLGTYNHPGYTSLYSTEESYKLTASIRLDLNLPIVVWHGLNAAWPLRQGFINRHKKSESKCCNPACDNMTYPRGTQLPVGAQKGSRAAADSADPLGGYICRSCYNYLEYHKTLPDVSITSKFAQRRAVKAEEMADTACGTCGRRESHFNGVITYTRKSGEVATYKRGFRVVPELGKLLCDACRNFFKKKKRERTHEEVQEFLRKSNSRSQKGRKNQSEGEFHAG